MTKTITDTVLMIRPHSFGYNVETALNNSFQSNDGIENQESIKSKAVEEFDKMVSELRHYDIEVVVMEDTVDPIKYDAVFPNNWLTTHRNGRLITYPMYASSRRNERREDVIDFLTDKYNYTKRYGFEYLESDEQYLEGTGSMIIDRDHNIIYAGLSPRTNIITLEKFAVLENCQKRIFHAFDAQGNLIYHTNVMMSLGADFSIICLDTIRDATEKNDVIKTLKNTGKDIIDITMTQMEHFAGNMLQVKSKLGQKYLIMSQSAYDSLTSIQIDHINKYTHIINIAIPTIEKYGGGSVRCMLAEIFKPS